ncbi:hypothetical protein IV494_14135 [Kaistella sp. G5-32]|uniref:Uncharacterized protein n=1 Tax=Kaistella gelatinilytica TaxID=2787636 RepID=A0ABS0FF29_9FLAO|nr:hypothetical protein [Kaistella gelatinilytica]MBF8458319.1 hypothetical protein [Kaistella gelatinilytica]
MKQNRFFKETEYKHWLIDNIITSPASAISYCSYVNSVNNELHFHDELEQIFNKQITKNFYEFILELLQVLSEKSFPERISKAPKTVQNWNSGIRAYGEFLVNNFQTEEVENTGNEITNECLLLEGNVSYSREQLYKNFTFRLITQDRFYDSIYFPISFIKKVLYKTGNRDFFDKWVKNILERTVLHTDNNEVQLKQVINLYFDAEGLKAEVKNKFYQVHTKHANNSDKSAFSTKELRKVALDHDKPMLAIMNELCDELIEIQKLTDSIKLKLNKRKIDRTVLAEISRELITELYLDEINIDRLKTDLELIGEDTNLQLMDGSFNASKKAN